MKDNLICNVEYINGEKKDKSDSNDEGEDDFYLEVY